MDEIIKQIEAEGFQWAVCKEVEGGGGYMAYVSEQHSAYIGDSLAVGLGCHTGETPAEALRLALDEELKDRAKRRSGAR